MKDYELVLIIKGNENKTPEVLGKIKELLSSKNIKINKEETWGLKKLAYPIKKEATGYYVILNITCDYPNLNAIEKSLQINEDLLRYRIFKFEDKVDKKIKQKPRRKK